MAEMDSIGKEVDHKLIRLGNIIGEGQVILAINNGKDLLAFHADLLDMTERKDLVSPQDVTLPPLIQFTTPKCHLPGANELVESMRKGGKRNVPWG